MNDETIKRLGDELYDALRSRSTLPPLTEREPAIRIEDAYHVSRHMVARRVEDGERIVGKKIGVTSKAVQRMLDVHQPDFGFLTDRMQHPDGAVLPISTTMIQPKAEGEIAFILSAELRGPGVTAADVLAATRVVKPCFEIVDSRITDWKIKIEDTVADNASCGVYVLGDDEVDPRQVDLELCGMVVEKNGEVISTGAGAAVQGSPLTAVAWLANTLGEFGIPLGKDEVILSGSLVPLEPVVAGDEMRLRIGGIGSATVRFE